MLNLLNASVGEYLRDNVVLTVVLALILALILVLSCIMIYLQVKAKKNGEASEAEQTEQAEDGETNEESEASSAQTEASTETAEPAPAQAEENAESEQAPAAQTEENAESEQAQSAAEDPVTEPVAQETPEKEPEAPEAEKSEPNETSAESLEKPAEKPVKKAKVEPVVKLAAKKPTPAKSAPAKKAEEKKDDDKTVGFQDGKWVIRKTSEGKYAFKLYASNGSVMLESSKEYSSLSTAKQGIETYKRNFQEGNCKIVSPKSGSFVYRLTNANGMLLAVSPNYTSKSSCENALENTKNYAKGAPVEVV